MVVPLYEYFHICSGFNHLQNACLYSIVLLASPVDCKTDQLGQSYAGSVDVTTTGKTCQRWDETTPHKPKKQAKDPANFPEDNIADASNFCRNPDKSPDGPWCYTMDEDKRWEYCTVPMCGM